MVYVYKHNQIHECTTFNATKIARIYIQNHMFLCTGILSTVLHIIVCFLARWANIHPHSRTISPISRGIRPCAFAVRWIFCLCKWNHQDSFISQQFCPYAIHNIFYNRHELVICVQQCQLVQRESCHLYLIF